MNVPDLIDPIIAYRSWQVCYDYDAGYDRLWSIGAGNTPWWPEMDARCAKDHRAPDSECQCGLYGWFEPEQFQGGGYLTIGGAGATPTANITGAIAVWGDVEIYQGGVRAEHAKVVALAGEGERFVKLAERYGVSLVAKAELQAEALKHGKSVPDDMRPKQPEGIQWGGTGVWQQSNNFSISMSPAAYTFSTWGGQVDEAETERIAEARRWFEKEMEALS